MKTGIPVAFLCLLLLPHFSRSQGCSPINIISSPVTAAACPSSGTITINATGTSLSYRITSGPTGYITASNTTGVFNTLAAGTYVVEVRDACNNTVNLTKVVPNTYPAFSVSNGTTSNVCTSGAAGGTVTGTISGGKPPYQYDIVLSGNSPAYGSVTAATSFSKNFTAFGIYRFYAKDACGEVRTYDISLQPAQPKPMTLWWVQYLRDRPCAETMDALPTITWRLHFLDENGQTIDFHQLTGSTWQLYKPNPANSITSFDENGSCTVTPGALLSSGTVLAANIPADDAYGYPITMPMEDVIFVFTNKCGHQYKACHDFNWGNPATPDGYFALIQQSCAASWNNQLISIENLWVDFMTYPLSFLLTKNNAQTITNSTGTFTGLKPADLPATVKITDACGRTVTKSFARPVQGSALQFVADPEWNVTCTNFRNTASAYIRITGGDLAGLAEATNVTITGGTVTAVPGISPYHDWIPGYLVTNLLAGYTYKISVTNLCGEKDSVIFTVPADQWGQNTLNWNLTASANALCGQNQGDITANAHYTGYGNLTYYLYNLSSPSTVISSNTDGFFAAVAPGSYKVKFVADNSSADCPGNLVQDSVTVTVLGDGVAQSITRKTITNCEVNGNPIPSGKAIIEVSGSAPFTYEIIKSSLVGTGATEVWTVSSVNNPSNSFTWDLPLAGDPATTQYSFRSSDKCDNKVTTQGSLQPLAPPLLLTSMNPCVGALNYSLSFDHYGGAFTYTWYKLPDTTTVISTTNTLTFPGAYNSADDGVYRCVISHTSCVSRKRDITVSSANCGRPLPLHLVYFGGQYANGITTLNWGTENENGVSHFETERSTDGVNFVFAKSVNAVNSPGGAATDYHVTDNPGKLNGTEIIYRLKMVDKDGRFTYSNSIHLSVKPDHSNLLVYPNPSAGETFLSFYSNTAASGTIRITDITGRPIMQTGVQFLKGANLINLPAVSNLPAGTYIVEALNGSQDEKTRLVKKMQ